MSMRGFRIILLVAALAFPGLAALAAESADFDLARFAAAQKGGRAILVDITAPWCPTCRAQKPIIERVTAAPEYRGLLIFHVDFDSQKDAVRQFGARSQSI
jgi:thiol-disulfide isomerase/thioredoxin